MGVLLESLPPKNICASPGLMPHFLIDPSLENLLIAAGRTDPNLSRSGPLSAALQLNQN